MLSMLTRLDEITEKFKEKLKSKESDLGKKLEKGGASQNVAYRK